MSGNQAVTTICVIVLLALPGCSPPPLSGDQVPADDEMPTYELRRVIGEEGGRVQVTDSASEIAGVYLDIPAGALSAPQEIVLATYSDGTSEELQFVGFEPIAVLSIEPSGTQFSLPAHIAIPYPDDRDPATLSVYRLDESSEAWEKLTVASIDESNRVILARTEHLSVFALGDSQPVEFRVEMFQRNNRLFAQVEVRTDLVDIPIHPASKLAYGTTHMRGILENMPRNCGAAFRVALYKRVFGVFGVYLEVASSEYRADLLDFGGVPDQVDAHIDLGADEYDAQFAIENDDMAAGLDEVETHLTGRATLYEFEETELDNDEKYFVKVFLYYTDRNGWSHNRINWTGDDAYFTTTISRAAQPADLNPPPPDSNGNRIIDAYEDIAPLPVQAPTFTPDGQRFSSRLDVRLDAEAGTSIRYTLDESTPSQTVGQECVRGTTITLTETTTLRAIAYRDERVSSVTEAVYEKNPVHCQPERPEFDSGGVVAFSGTLAVAITCDPGARILYTTDDTTPTSEPRRGEELASGEAVTLSDTTTLRAIAFERGCDDSRVRSQEYEKINIAEVIQEPIFDPVSGYEFPNNLYIYLEYPILGADVEIYYTLDDGGMPGPTNGTLYTERLHIYETHTVHAIACEDDRCSDAVSATFYKDPEPGTITVISPAAGDAWPASAPATVTWQSNGVAERLSILLSIDGGDTWDVLEWNVAAADGTAEVDIPTDIASDDCVIRVEERNVDNGVWADSGSFVIEEKTITLTGPVGGEVWTVGLPAMVTWDSTYNVEYVTVEFYPSSIDWITLAENVPNENYFYVRTVPNEPGDYSYVRVREADGQPWSLSPEPFRVVAEDGTWVQWSTSDGGSGHWYRLTEPGDWPDVDAEAAGHGGYLAAINSASENSWLTANFCGESFWIGLYQDEDDPECTPSCEPSGGWKWTSGESVSYTNWVPGEPNDYRNDEFGGVYCGDHTSANYGRWNDFYAGYFIMPGVVERNDSPY